MTQRRQNVEPLLSNVELETRLKFSHKDLFAVSNNLYPKPLLYMLRFLYQGLPDCLEKLPTIKVGWFEHWPFAPFIPSIDCDVPVQCQQVTFFEFKI